MHDPLDGFEFLIGPEDGISSDDDDNSDDELTSDDEETVVEAWSDMELLPVDDDS